ncbi:hypothetical protein ACT7DD_15195 [Bacillus paranthracis]
MLELLVQQAIEKVIVDYKIVDDDNFKKMVVKEFTNQLYKIDQRSLLTEVTDILYSQTQIAKEEKEKNFTNTNLPV